MKFLPAALSLLPLLALAAVPADARKAPPPANADARVSTLTVYGSDPCPRSTGDEIIVCARLPESERYRIPKRFRGSAKADLPHAAWGAQARQLETVSRQGVPDSCSVVGSGGQSGCYRQFLQHAREQRQQDKEDAAGGN